MAYLNGNVYTSSMKYDCIQIKGLFVFIDNTITAPSTPTIFSRRINAQELINFK